MVEKVRNRTCPLCDQYIPTDVVQLEIKIGGEDRGVHESCAKVIAEAYMTRMLHVVKKEKRKKKRRMKKAVAETD